MAVITPQMIDEIAESRWREFQKLITYWAEVHGMETEELLDAYHIQKPDFRKVIVWCDSIVEEKMDWDQWEMGDCIIALDIATEILKEICRQHSQR